MFHVKHSVGWLDVRVPFHHVMEDGWCVLVQPVEQLGELLGQGVDGVCHDSLSFRYNIDTG